MSNKLQNRNKRMKKVDIHRVCRICIKDKNHLREIHQTRIPKMIESCASIQVSENDGLPCKVCVGCFHMITKFYTFKKQIERSDRILRQYINHSAKIRQSDIINIALSDAEIQESNAESNKQLTQTEIQDLWNRNNVVKQEESVKIFPDGPPPLIPLEPNKKLEVTDNTIKNLPEDTPPLIPIKPQVDLETLDNLEVKDQSVKYQCNSCSKEFASITSLKTHKSMICKPCLLTCNICNKEFKDSKKLIGHLKGHMISKDYCCKICGKRYPNPSTFAVHIRSHTGERPFKCNICDKGFTRWAGVVGHLKSHAEDKPHECETCGRCFKNSSNLTRHKIKHTGTFPFQCTYCLKRFNQSDNLQVHIKMNHTNDRPYLCSECGKGFVNSTRLNRYALRHTLFPAKNWFNWNRHMWVHSGYKPHPCTWCSKRYSNSLDLRTHERRAHLGQGIDELKRHACDRCDRRFFHPCRLAKHKATHDAPAKQKETIMEETANVSFEQPEGNVPDLYVGYREEVRDEKPNILVEYVKMNEKNESNTVMVKYVYNV